MEKKRRIFEYLDTKPGNAAVSRFESDIKEDDELYHEFIKVKDSLSKLDRLAEVEPDSHYFESVLPKFRENLDNRRQKRYFPLFAKFGTGLAVTAACVTLLVMQPWTTTTVETGVKKVEVPFAKNNVENSTLTEKKEQKAESPAATAYRYTSTAGQNSPLFEKGEKNELLLNSGVLSDDEALSAHSKFEEAYNSILEMNRASLLEIADKYGVTLDEVVQNLSDEEIEKLTGHLDPIIN